MEPPPAPIVRTSSIGSMIGIVRPISDSVVVV
jgi:hypothetical protein